MDPVRPIPLRPFDKERDNSEHNHGFSPRLSHSKSTADISSLSRTSSFLGFGALESLKSSALFGIFERSGMNTDPPTPDVHGRPDDFFPTDGLPAQSEQQARSHSIFGTLLNSLGVFAGSFIFFILFNQIPNNNKFIAISPAESIHPLAYATMAVMTACVFPLLDEQLKMILPERKHASRITKKAPRNEAHADSAMPVGINRKSSSSSFSVLIRYFAGFLGLAYAGTKLDFSQSSQFVICVSAISLAVSLILDRTTRGLILSLTIASVVSCAYLLVMQTPPQDTLGVIALVWLNVSVYGSLGKVLRSWS